jgi:uncharacterized protein YbjT (DUF2867 family)
MTPSTTNSPLILVIAANGKTGSRVAERLEEQGVAVRRGSRSAAIPFDWNNRDTWAPALHGVTVAYVVYTPDLAVPQAAEDLEVFTKIAKQCGVEKLVLLSGRGEPEARQCELIVQQSGLAWTIVRASWFNQNFSEGEFVHMVNAGNITLPNPDALEPFIDIDDIAEVAVAALTDSRHDGELYEVTGPELLTFADVAGKLSEATGQQIEYTPITIDQFNDGLVEAGVPEDFAKLLRYLFELTATGVNAHVADGVQRALGRAPRSFSTYAKDAATQGAWPASEAMTANG